MTEINELYRMRLVEKRKIARIDNRPFLEEEFIIRSHSDSNETDEAIEISHQPLLNVPKTFNLIRVKEASKKYGLKKGRIRKLCRTGQIVAEKIGRKWQIVEESLVKYLENLELFG